MVLESPSLLFGMGSFTNKKQLLKWQYTVWQEEKHLKIKVYGNNWRYFMVHCRNTHFRSWHLFLRILLFVRQRDRIHLNKRDNRGRITVITVVADGIMANRQRDSRHIYGLAVKGL